MLVNGHLFCGPVFAEPLEVGPAEMHSLLAAAALAWDEARKTNIAGNPFVDALDQLSAHGMDDGVDGDKD